MTAPTLTPNVRIEDPRTRKVVGNILGWCVIALMLLNLVDANLPAIDLAWLAEPAAGILAGLLALYQLLITSPNVATPANPVDPPA